jgi:hypothetical protein
VKAPLDFTLAGERESHAAVGSVLIRRLDGEIERVAGLVPNAAVIAGHHAEAVVARRKIAIEH